LASGHGKPTRLLAAPTDAVSRFTATVCAVLATRDEPDRIPLVSIVVVTHNNDDLIRECLDAIVDAARRYPSEIIVVDNASADSTVEVVERGGWSVDVIRSTENVGFARAVNLAWERARGRYVALVNSDAFLDIGCIDQLVTTLEERPQAGLFGDLWVALCLHRVPGLSRLGIGYLAEESLYRRPRKVDWVSAAVCASRVEVGPMPTSSFMYGEDVEWALACRNAGWEVWLEPAASAVHVGRASVDHSQDAGFAQRQRVEFELAWFAPRGQAVQLVARLALVTHALLRLVVYGARMPLPDHRGRRTAEYVALFRAALSPRRPTR
jgi:GT2 family glycosyltransferase